MEPLWISLLAAVISAFVASLIGALAARVRFSAQRGLRWALDILFLLPLAIPGIVPVLVWDIIWHPSTPAMITAGEALSALPVFYLCAIMGFRKVARETIDAAQLQGLGRCGIFWRVFLPVAWKWLLGGFAIGLWRGVCLALLGQACPQV